MACCVHDLFASCVRMALVKSELIILPYCFCVVVNRPGELQDPEKKSSEGS